MKGSKDHLLALLSLPPLKAGGLALLQREKSWPWKTWKLLASSLLLFSRVKVMGVVKIIKVFKVLVLCRLKVLGTSGLTN